ncbi:hypothetical protein GQ600_18750 [Phytophthora cactorum]|nr:hypothetical protein GQ600_18750 [Phytophthora cactorum]
MAPPSGRTAVTTSEAAGHEAPLLPTRKLPSDDLPTEAAVLKRRIWASHPGSVYKFRLDKMKRVVTPPVEIPPPLSIRRCSLTRSPERPSP